MKPKDSPDRISTCPRLCSHVVSGEAIDNETNNITLSLDLSEFGKLSSRSFYCMPMCQLLNLGAILREYMMHVPDWVNDLRCRRRLQA